MWAWAAVVHLEGRLPNSGCAPSALAVVAEEAARRRPPMVGEADVVRPVVGEADEARPAAAAAAAALQILRHRLTAAVGGAGAELHFLLLRLVAAARAARSAEAEPASHIPAALGAPAPPIPAALVGATLALSQCRSCLRHEEASWGACVESRRPRGQRRSAQMSTGLRGTH